MEKEKRKSKPPQAFIIDKACYPRIRPKSKKKKREILQYRVIPTPIKFSCVANFYGLYGVI